MQEPSNSQNPPAVGGKRLAWSVVAAAAVAGVVLLTAVLPAEYGVDPTGVGKLLGLDSMRQPVGQTFEIVNVVGGNETYRNVEIPDFGEPVPLPNPDVHQDEMDVPPRSQTMTVELDVDEETEIKALLTTGKMILYSWRVDRGTIYSDFHGHDPEAGDEYWVRYKEQQEGKGNNGSLVAPFSGEHGWYWQNYNGFPVVITLTITGYYDDIVDYGIL